MSKIILGAVVEGISTRSDNSFKIVVGTQEVDKNQVADLFDLRNKFCKIFISDNNISPLEEKLIDEEHLKDGKKIKTKSQRYRAVQNILWKQSGSELDFESYYNNHMDEIIEKEKEKIEP